MSFSRTGTRLRNVRIGVSNVSPTTRVPALGNFDVCFYYYGVYGAGETRTFPCPGGLGRYLIVQLEQKQYLTLCEVKVFAGTVVCAVGVHICTVEGACVYM